MTRGISLLLFLLLTSSAAIATVLVLYGRDIGHVRERADQGAHVVATMVGPIQYAEKGEGIPLLSIHGAGGGFDQGLANVAGWVGEGYRVIAPSRFGYLATPVPTDTSPSAQASAHIALLDYLGVERAIVIGVSAGAVSALEMVLRHPDRVTALILVVPATYDPTNPVSIEASSGSKVAFKLVNAGADFLWWALEKLAPDVLIRFIGVPPDVVAESPQAERERVIEIVRSIQPLSRRTVGINIDSLTDLHPLPLEDIRTPALVISAADDLFNTRPAAEFAAQHISDAKLIIFKTGGHLLVGRSDEVREVIHRFLADIQGVNTGP